jgi:malate dehydrogenase
MLEVAILGAGDLGGSLAMTLARRAPIRRIRLIDPAGSVAAGKALDLQQAGAIEGFGTEIGGSDDVTTASGADIIALADQAGATSSEWSGESGLRLLTRVAHVASHATFLCAGARQRELVERGVRDLKIPPTRLFGTAPAALCAAVRAIVGLELDRAAVDVSVTVLGVPPSHVVVPWEAAGIDGEPLFSMIPSSRLRRIEERLMRLWPPGPYALASAAAAVCRTLGSGSHRSFTCFVYDDRGVALSAPVQLGRHGIDRVLPVALSARDQVIVDNAIGKYTAVR